MDGEELEYECDSLCSESGSAVETKCSDAWLEESESIASQEAEKGQIVLDDEAVALDEEAEKGESQESNIETGMFIWTS
jgi:hypothetical protein